jgi:Phage major capsid protein E
MPPGLPSAATPMTELRLEHWPLDRLTDYARNPRLTGVMALVSPEFFDKLISHAKVEEAYKYYASTGAQPLREDTRPRFPFAGIVFEEYNATVTPVDRRDRDPDPRRQGIAFPLGTIDTFATYGAPANLIDTVNTVGLPIYARQIARPDGSAIEVKTEASIFPVNNRPRLAVRIHSSN